MPFAKYIQTYVYRTVVFLFMVKYNYGHLADLNLPEFHVWYLFMIWISGLYNVSNRLYINKFISSAAFHQLHFISCITTNAFHLLHFIDCVSSNTCQRIYVICCISLVVRHWMRKPPPYTTFQAPPSRGGNKHMNITTDYQIDMKWILWNHNLT